MQTNVTVTVSREELDRMASAFGALSVLIEDGDTTCAAHVARIFEQYAFGVLDECSPSSPPNLAALDVGAVAFKRVVAKIGAHMDALPADAEDFDYAGAARLLLDGFGLLNGDGALGFLITAAEYIVNIKGPGEPVDDFEHVGVKRWQGRFYGK